MSRRTKRKIFSLVLCLFVWVFALLLIPNTSFAFSGCGLCGTVNGKNYGQCTTCCDGIQNCSQGCNQPDPNYPGECAWTIANSCDNWGPWSPCDENHCQVRYCDDGVHDRDMEVGSCGGGHCGQETPKEPGCAQPPAPKDLTVEWPYQEKVKATWTPGTPGTPRKQSFAAATIFGGAGKI